MDRRLSMFALLTVSLVVSSILLELYSAQASTSVFYVAPYGDDANLGTIDQPWRTIQHAADAMVAGDTVYIREGVYEEQVFTVRSGDPVDGYIVFSNYAGEVPVIDGARVTTGDNGFVIAHSFIKLLGLEICNWEENGVWTENAGSIEISDCTVHDVWYGIGLADGTHDFVLNRVEMYNFTLYGFDASPSGGANCYNGVLNDCVAHSARDPTQNVDGFALGHGDQHDFVFNRCVAYDVYDGFVASACNTMLSRCVAYDCWYTGYKLWQDNVTLVNCLSYHNKATNVELDWDGDPGTVTLQNCDFVDCEEYNIWVENSGDRLRMYNCIIACGDNIGLAFEQRDATNYQGDYNIFHNDDAERAIVVGYEDEFSLNQIALTEWSSYSGQDQHSLISSDPATELFQDLSNWDFHLREGSIALGAGTSANCPSVDYDGVSRPPGEGCDIGAFVPEFPSLLILALFMIGTLLAVIVYRRNILHS